MEIYRIAFIGHRRICGQYSLENEIEMIAREKLCEKEYIEFYVERNGDFDISVASAVKKTQKAVGYHNSFDESFEGERGLGREGSFSKSPLSLQRH